MYSSPHCLSSSLAVLPAPVHQKASAICSTKSVTALHPQTYGNLKPIQTGLPDQYWHSILTCRKLLTCQPLQSSQSQDLQLGTVIIGSCCSYQRHQNMTSKAAESQDSIVRWTVSLDCCQEACHMSALVSCHGQASSYLNVCSVSAGCVKEIQTRLLAEVQLF